MYFHANNDDGEKKIEFFLWQSGFVDVGSVVRFQNIVSCYDL